MDLRDSSADRRQRRGSYIEELLGRRQTLGQVPVRAAQAPYLHILPGELRRDVGAHDGRGDRRVGRRLREGGRDRRDVELGEQLRLDMHFARRRRSTRIEGGDRRREAALEDAEPGAIDPPLAPP